METKPWFEKTRQAKRAQLTYPTSPESGSTFQKIMTLALGKLTKPEANRLYDRIVSLSVDPDRDPITIDHQDAVILRVALEVERAGIEARIAASDAYDAAAEAGKAADRRARAWADAYGMREAHRNTNAGDRTALRLLVSYVNYLGQEVGGEGEITHSTREERLRAVGRTQREFELQSRDATIQALIRSRKNPFVVQIWPSDYPPLAEIPIPGRRPT